MTGADGASRAAAADWLAGTPSARCIRDDDRDWLTRAELRAVVDRFADRLSKSAPGLVFLYAANDVPSAVGLLAAWSAGLPVALLDRELSSQAIAQLLRVYRPEVVLGLDASVAGAAYEAQQPELDAVPPALLARARAEVPLHSELALLLSTSGSTGSPKFVRLSSRAMFTNARQICAALAIDALDIGIAHLPLHYSYGLSVVTSHLLAGAAVTLTKMRLTEAAFWQRVRDDSATHFPGVPFHYSVIDRLRIDRTVPPAVRTFTQAGGHLEHATRRRCHAAITARGGRFYIMYGQTEAGPRITTLDSDDFPAHSHSVGKVLSGGTLSIVDDQGRAQSAGEEGNVVYEGENVMMGYALGREDLSLGDTQKGRLDTGDRGVLSDDGFLTLTGRTQRFAKIEGLRIALDDVEAAFAPAGAVAAVAPQGKIVLFAEHAARQAVTRMIPGLAQSLRLPSTVFVVRSLERLPLKPSGKIDYRALEHAE